MSFKDLAKKAHDAFITDDGEESKPKATPTVTKIPGMPTIDFSRLGGSNGGSTVAAAPSFSAPSPFAVPGTTVLDEAVYQRVLAKTNFDETPVGKVIHGYYDGLEDMDVNTRFKTAIKLAGKRDGITPDQVLGAFDSLKTSLQAENDKFSRAVDTQMQKEVAGRQQTLQTISDNITKLNQQIADLQAQHTQVSAELVDAQGKIGNATTQMQLAVSRRASEIDQQKSQFSGLLR